jgi:hypothetical protein
MNQLQESISEILEILKPKEINTLCEFDLYNGWLRMDQIEMLWEYFEYQRDKKRLKEEVRSPLIIEFNESHNVLYSYISNYFYFDKTFGKSRLIKYEGERYNEGGHLERYHEVQKLNDDFHEKYNNLRIELSKT